ncbi:MAG: IS91 family transposase [Myxococcales bacterium]|nr:IS91 family transposase [Myxococcales bacterium]
MHAACASDGARGKRPALELADIVRLHGTALRRARALTPEQHRTLFAIERCRTAALGGHLDVCLRCGDKEPAYNSCRDRHCPKCQALAQAKWVRARSERLLPVPYFHVVFTLPAELRAIAKLNRRLVLELLFETASATLLELGLDPKRLGALLGVTAVLHTWTRDLRWHPHLHCIVTGGGWSVSESRWLSGRARYLLPVKVLGALFRGKFLAALRRAHRAGELRLPDEPGPRDPQAFDRLLVTLRAKSWVVYAKRPFGGAEQVVRYLGRYTHRVGISNRRLVSLDQSGVTFRTKSGKSVTVEPVEFLSRFVEHVLPPRFVKIRHYGLLAPAHVAISLAAARCALSRPKCETTPSLRSAAPVDLRKPRQRDDWQSLLLELTGIDVGVCRACGARAVERRPLHLARAPPAEAA